MELGERKCKILEAVVHDYVQTAEPVGSEALARKYNLGVKPATIRNEMAEMSELGYLRQPHTSAGRVPSDLGYRFYVDWLMPPARLSTVESYRARRAYDPYETEIEVLLHRTCRILSELTRYTSLAIPPRTEAVEVEHVALSLVKRDRLLVVTVLNTGQVIHKILDFEGFITATDMLAVGNLVSERLRGADMDTAALRAEEEMPVELTRLRPLYEQVVSLVRQALVSTASDDVYMDGTSRILRQPEFSQADRMAAILDALEQRKVLFQILSSAFLGEDVTVIIGGENRVAGMAECSFVASRYHVGDRVCGSIGVIGPTRMDYRRAVAAVRFMASNLSDVLTHLAVG